MPWNNRIIVFAGGVFLAVMFVLGLHGTGIRGSAMEPSSAPTEGGPAETVQTTPVAGATVRPATDDKESAMTRKAIFGAGCFWGVESAFRSVKGVIGTAVGYSGGKTEKPSYRLVCTGITGHAEVVLVEYDPKVVSYEKLLDTFWKCHDPTTRNRQGPDVGTQYRSAIFYLDEDQKKAAEKSKAELEESGAHGDREVVTEITKAGDFWRAEEYHQQYHEKRGKTGCALP